ncbi:MAG: hypothetical protein CRN43_13170 [Candidatus Nephrothrix sp. EaCA]|nr:MAG: hypothetical protein CRN43_13170 [Candidatus Nephrothrix sp. EaCA]
MTMRFFVLLALLAFIAACSHRGYVVKTRTKSLYHKHQKVAVEEITADYLDGKAKLTISSEGKTRHLKANLRMRRDSVIWMNFSVAAIAGGRALINPDSITILNYIDNEYYVYRFQEISKEFNFKINFEMLQAALLGNLMFKNTEVDTAAVGQALLSKDGSVVAKSFVDAETNKINRVEMKDENTGSAIAIEYSYFQFLNLKRLPYSNKINIHYKTKNGPWKDLMLHYEFIKVEERTKELKFPFNIPKRYERR